MERITKFAPAYDKRDSNPSKNYGICSVRCWMMLRGDKGVVQFAFMTAMYLPHVAEEHKHKGYFPEPMGMDVGYHSPKPMYEGQLKMDECDFYEGGCYYDGSSLRAEEWFNIFLREGSDRIWEMLEQDYKERFGDEVAV